MQPDTHKTEPSFTDLHTYYLLPHQTYTHTLKIHNFNIHNLQPHSDTLHTYNHKFSDFPTKSQIVNARTRKKIVLDILILFYLWIE